MGQPNKALKGRKNSETCNKIYGLLTQVGEAIKEINLVNDGSHGVVFSMPSHQPVAGEEKPQTPHIMMWGEQKDITLTLLLACKSNKEFASMVIAVAVKMMQDRAGNQPQPEIKTAGEA